MHSTHRRSNTRRVAVALGIVAFAGFAFAGCRTQAMLTPSPIHTSLGSEQNREAIRRGMAAHRWKLVSEDAGRVTARQDKGGKHTAVVDIVYDDRTISIRYRDSTNLRCEREGDSCRKIHRAYNRWVVNLARDIEYAVEAM